VKALIVANEFLETEVKQLQAAVSYVHGGSVEAMKAAIELLTFDGFAVASCRQGILSERRPQAIRSVIRIIPTALLTLDVCSFVFLLQVQTKFFLAP
jgi:hypothetical protein